MKNRLFLKYFLAVYIPVFIFIVGLFFLAYFIKLRIKKDFLLLQEQDRVERCRVEIIQALQDTASDIIFLSELSTLQSFIQAQDGFSLSLAENDFLHFLSIKKKYDQVRYLDMSGQEMIRINYNKGSPQAVARDQLQNKSNRYYFSETVLLQGKQVFVSPLDLNIEQQKIERPLKPMIRFGVGVYDKHQNKQGIVVLNYFGKKIFDIIRKEESYDASGEMLMINSDGYWLQGLNQESEWGFMFNNENTFGEDFPKEWEKIKGRPYVQLESQSGFFTARSIYPLSESQVNSQEDSNSVDQHPAVVADEDYYWQMISFIQKEKVILIEKNIREEILWLFIPLLFIVTLAIFFIAEFWKNQGEARKQI